MPPTEPAAAEPMEVVVEEVPAPAAAVVAAAPAPAAPRLQPVIDLADDPIVPAAAAMRPAAAPAPAAAAPAVASSSSSSSSAAAPAAPIDRAMQIRIEETAFTSLNDLGEKITLKQLRHDMERRLGVESLKEWKENGTIKAVATAFAKGARRREEMAAALNHQAAGTLDAMSMGDLTFTHMAQPPQ